MSDHRNLAISVEGHWLDNDFELPSQATIMAEPNIDRILLNHSCLICARTIISGDICDDCAQTSLATGELSVNDVMNMRDAAFAVQDRARTTRLARQPFMNGMHVGEAIVTHTEDDEITMVTVASVQGAVTIGFMRGNRPTNAFLLNVGAGTTIDDFETLDCNRDFLEALQAALTHTLLIA